MFRGMFRLCFIGTWVLTKGIVGGMFGCFGVVRIGVQTFIQHEFLTRNLWRQPCSYSRDREAPMQTPIIHRLYDSGS